MNVAASVDSVLYRMTCYPNKSRVRNDAVTLLSSYTGLRALASPAPTGPQPLFGMTGTIPVIIQANKYNIPIHIWIPEAYPYRPPMVYVTPTGDMTIAPHHPHVDAGGVVYLPYLNTWNPATHNLLLLVQAMCLVFGKQSPLYAVQRGAAPPPYPGQPGYGMGPGPGAGAGAQPGPYPGQPRPPAPGYGMGPGPQPSYPGQQPAPYPGQYPAAQRPPQPQYPGQGHRPPPPNPAEAKRQQLRELCRAKIRELTSEDLGQKTASLEEEKRKKEMLVCDEETQRQQLDRDIAEYQARLKELDGFIEANRKGFDIDKATDSKDVQRLQLIQCVATDLTIEDVLYHLDRALLKGVLELDDYLKLFRQYSNDQFYQRALTKKIRETLGRPTR